MADKYPVALHHPHFRKGPIKELAGVDPVSGKKFTDYQGEPDLFPPVTVNNADQEAFHRAKGYLAAGESEPAPADYAEYPVMLSHPDHEDAVPDDFDIKKGPGGEVISTRIPGRPEKLPGVMAKTAAEEKAWAAKGYKRSGVADGLASQKAKASPFDPNYTGAEYPKMVDGKIVDPHNTLQHNRYPMYVGQILANNEAEERAARKNMGPILPAGPCVICGEAFTAEQKWRNGAAGPFHEAHVVSEGPGAPGSKKRKVAAQKAAETKRQKKERERQAAQAG